MVQLLEELSILADNPGRGENEQPLISEHYKEVTPLRHLIQSGNCALAFNYTYKSLFYEVRVSFDERRLIREAKVHNEQFKKLFHEKREPLMFHHGQLKNGEQTIRIDSHR
jgi:hypothetical protein